MANVLMLMAYSVTLSGNMVRSLIIVKYQMELYVPMLRYNILQDN